MALRAKRKRFVAAELKANADGARPASVAAGSGD
jgi:hypothetical protein